MPTRTFSAVTATETAIIAGDATGAVWFLDWPHGLVHVADEPTPGSATARKP